MARPIGTRNLILLFVLLVVAATGAIVQDVRYDTSLATERSAAAALDRHFESAIATLADIRAAQAGYVATGQGAAFWMTRVSDLSASLTDTIDRVTAAVTSAEGATHCANASAALGELLKFDEKARSQVKNDNRILASDAIFMDSLGASQRAASELMAARQAEHAASDARVTRTARLRLITNGACLIVAILISAVFLRATLVWISPMSSVTAPAANASATSIAPAQPTAATPASDVSITDAAELCVDLARVLDARDVGALFDRAAVVLGAKGLVLWASDTSGALLRPTLTHGYPERILARMSGLQVDGDNATAVAFRTMQTQVVPGNAANSAGAIAVPLITANGCVGVLSAETKTGKPGKDAVAVAKMIAAQLSALVAPGSDASAQSAAGN